MSIALETFVSPMRINTESNRIICWKSDDEVKRHIFGFETESGVFKQGHDLKSINVIR